MDSNPYKSPEARREAVQRGLLFNFDIEAGKLQVDARSPLGILRIRFNGELVYKKFTYARVSTHNFSLNDRPYKVLIKVVNARKGEIECGLYCDDTLLTNYATAYDFDRPDYLAIAFIFFVSLCTATIVSRLDLSKWIIVGVLFLVFILVRIRSLKNIAVYMANT